MKISLRTKTILLIVLLSAILGAAGLITSGRYISRLMDDASRKQAKELTDTIAVTIDAERFESLTKSILAIYSRTENKVISDAWGTPEFDAYIAHFKEVEDSEDFRVLLEQLRRIQAVNDVDCLYLSCIDQPTEGFLYAVDAAEEDPCPPGCLDPIFEENREVLTNPSRGFPAYITNTETYGWLVTAGAPVYNKAGAVIGYAMADISMDALIAKQRGFILSFAALLAVITLLICLASIWIVNRSIIGPINKLSRAAANYSAGNHAPGDNVFEKLDIRTKDELESLCDTMKTMLTDMNGYIDSLKSTMQELSKTRIEADEMGELARRDLLTGVRNKNAYNEDIADIRKSFGATSFGIAVIDLNGLKEMNDLYGHDKGDQAIKNICAMICDTFAHSPVYRFGGDEFVVVLRGRDYANVDELIGRFIALEEAGRGEPWEAPKAAIGYAAFDSRTDDSVESVFQRADALMYEHKKEMKAGK